MNNKKTIVIKTIYASPICYKCKIAQEKFPEAEYKLITEISKEEQDILFDRLSKASISSVPVLEDSEGNFIDLKEVGLNF